MELWIRSQDRKSLVKVNEIKFYERNGHYYIGDGFEDNYASYKSKERALEVLDEIQNYICPNGSINLYDGTRVYELPKE